MSSQRKGELYITAQAVLWGLFPVITILSYVSLPPLISLGTSTFFAALFFSALVTFRDKWDEIKNTRVLVDILWTTLFLGVLFYVFFFLGLQYTSAGNASIIELTETLTSFLLFHLWRKEHIPVAHIVGCLVMLLGAGIILFPNFSGIHIGDFFILAAAAVAPFGNFFQQRARRAVSSETILCIRSIIVVPVVFLLAWFMGERITVQDIRVALPLLIVSGVFLFGLSKMFWVEGIHRVSVTKANALSSISPVFTLLFAWALLRSAPTAWQLFALVPMMLGTILLGVEEK